MLSKIRTFILIMLVCMICAGCSALNPSGLRYRLLYLWDDFFSEATVTMPVLVTSTQSPTPTLVPTATLTPTITMTPTKTTVPWKDYTLPTFEVLETQSLPISLRDSINQVRDVTVPDNTILQPNQLFIKSWRMTNSGDSTWENGTKLMMDTVFDTELPTVVKAVFLKENDWINFTPGGWGDLVHNVAPGTRVDLAVILRAPSQAGSYQIQFRLVNSKGELINTPFWMQFYVAAPTETPTPEPPSATPTPVQNTPYSGQGTPIAIQIVDSPTVIPETYDWNGHWMVREPFLGDTVVPAHAWFYQTGEELIGFLYNSIGDPIIVKGALFDKGRTFNGEIYHPWQKQTTSVIWRMQLTGDQFYAVTPLGVLDDTAVCGSRNGSNLPDLCTLPAGA